MGDHVDHGGLDKLRRTHPAWRVLLVASVPLVASLLHRVFVLPNARMVARVDLLERLQDKLYPLRQTQGARVAALWNPKTGQNGSMRENVV